MPKRGPYRPHMQWGSINRTRGVPLYGSRPKPKPGKRRK